MTTKKKERMSNFELLRIVAMVLIIIHHIFVHAITPQLVDGTLFGPGEMFNNLLYYRRLTLVDFANSFGKIGNDLFLLITGYFCLSKSNLNIKNKVYKLISQLFFAVLLLVGASTIYNIFIDKSFYDIVGINIFNTEFWFIGYYLLIIIIGDLFLNKKINKLSKEKFTTLIFIITSLISFSFSLGFFRNIASGLEIIISGIYFYLVGGYIRKYNPFNNIRNIVFVLIIIAAFLFMTVSYRNSALSSINYLKTTNFAGTAYQTYFNGYSEGSLICIMISVSLFELFRRVKLKNNSAINYISTSTFMIYLIHDNPFCRSLMKTIEWIPMYHDNLLLFILYIIAVIITIIIISLISYFLYAKSMNAFKNKIIKSIIIKK